MNAYACTKRCINPHNARIIVSTKKIVFFSLLLMAAIVSAAFSSAPYRVDTRYEDTVRVAIIWNDPGGNSCGNGALHQPVGEKTRDFVLAALDTGKVKNVKVVGNYGGGPKATWADIVAMWGEDSLPHVIAHVNAGWSNKYNGAELKNIFSEAVARKIGVVSIGDDAANLANETFGFENVENIPAPLGDGRNVDSLWIGMLGDRDEALKTYVSGNTLAYPGVNGIISNAIDSLLSGSETLHFYPYGEGRCQADADKYSLTHPEWLTLLGYQQGYLNTTDQPGDDEHHVIVAIQDTVDFVVRRGVALSFQPQFLMAQAASEQIVYDAIMFASLAHLLVAERLKLDYPEKIAAGDTAGIVASLFHQAGKYPELLKQVEWEIVDDTVAGDTLLNATGAQTGFIGEKAHRTVEIQATYWINRESGEKLVARAAIQIVPGPLDSISIEDANKRPVTDTIRLNYPDDNINLYTAGFDAYGNRIGSATAAWKSTETLHQIAGADSTSQIFYESKNVTADEAGSIVAQSSENPRARDSVYVVIAGPKVTLQRAITRDFSGNGYLDAIELQFSRVIALPDNFDVVNNVVIWYTTNDGVRVTFEPSGFKSSDSSSTFILYLKENDMLNVPQTGWKPFISFTGHDDVQNVENKQCEDGAGPVIWAVTKTIGSINSRVSDKVVVTFSEPISGDGQADFNKATSPADVFNAYLVSGSDTTYIDSMFEGIVGFSEVQGSALIFNMTNGHDLTGRHWLSIKTSPSPQLEDRQRNDPDDDNRKVRVVVKGDLGPIAIGPNPMYPTMKHFEEKLSYRKPEDAFRWARTDGGAIMIAEIILPEPGEDFKVTAALVVFDAIGNVAYSTQNNDDIIPRQWRSAGWVPGENRQLVFYWNGITNDNRKAAPGIYRAIIYIDTQTEQQKFIGNVGIGR